MAVIQYIDGLTRRIYLNPSAATGGVLSFHPILDVYREYKALRLNNEAIRPFNAFMIAQGNLPKGGGKFTPRFLQLLQGAKIVIPSGVSRVIVSGELLTDDQSDPLDVSQITGPCRIDYQPAEAEIIQVSTSGNTYSLDAIREAVWSKQISGPVSAAVALKLMSAILIGKTEITDNGNGTATVVFRDIHFDDVRVTAHMNGSERSDVLINP